jgi:hypothetical protein|tara:strand:- start:279 stop:518 length:240 start_codon:yes stop_codon:yes gene_type:complete
MPKWNEWVDGIEIKDDLESLIDEVRSEVKNIKAKSTIQQDKLEAISKILFEAKLKAKELEFKNRVLKNKVSILEEDLNL